MRVQKVTVQFVQTDMFYEGGYVKEFVEQVGELALKDLVR